MHFIIDRSKLYGLIQKVIPATLTSGAMPIFACVRIEAKEGILQLSATDSRITIKAVEACEFHEGGAVGVSGKSFLDILNNFPEGPITVSFSGNRLQLKGKKAAVHIATVPEEHFPMMPDFAGEFIDCPGFFESTRKVDFATTADDTSRIFLSGVRLADKRMAATDGHRLALLAFNHDFGVPVTIPSDLLRRAVKAVGDKSGVAVTDSRVFFKGDKVWASIATLAPNYPDYQKIIPQTPHQDIRVPTKEFKDALDLMKAAADQKELSVTLVCEDGIIKMSSRSDDVEGKFEVPAQFKEPAKVTVSIRYLLDVIDRLVNKDEVVFELRGEITPLVIKEEGYINVIMPRRPT